MTAPDPTLAKLLADLDAARTALSAHLLGATQHPLEPNESNFVPLKTAAMIWGISQDAALPRARRSHGLKRFGRWYFPESVVYPAKAGSAI